MMLPDIEISRLEDIIEHLNSKIDSMDSIQKHLESEIQRLLDVIGNKNQEIIDNRTTKAKENK